MTAAVNIISFGHQHGWPPDAGAIIDLRRLLDDPRVDTGLKHLHADDKRIQRAVHSTPGVARIINMLTDLAFDLHATARITGVTATIAIGCTSGRHFAPVIARAVHAADDRRFTIKHRDLDKDVVGR